MANHCMPITRERGLMAEPRRIAFFMAPATGSGERGRETISDLH